MPLPSDIPSSYLPASFLCKFEAAEPRELSIGYRTVSLWDVGELEAGQVGYSRAPDGADLTSSDPGGWVASWLVIGVEDQCGDPLFVDLAVPGFPVYTAMHGLGMWDPDQIGDSFGTFVSALRDVASEAEGRTNPVELEENSIATATIKSLLERIQKSNPTSDMNFWSSWFEID